MGFQAWEALSGWWVMWKAPGRLYFKRVTKKSLDSDGLNAAYMRLTEHPTDKQSYSRESTKLNIWWSITWNRLRLFLLWSSMRTGCLSSPAPTDFRNVSRTWLRAWPPHFKAQKREIRQRAPSYMFGNEPEKRRKLETRISRRRRRRLTLVSPNCYSV